MSFVGVAIAGAIGFAGTTAAVSAAAINFAIGVGLSFAARALLPKPRATVPGVRVGLQTETDPARDVILGEAATGGQLVYWHTYGPSNKYLQMVVALASHPIQDVTEVRIDGAVVTRNPSTGVITEYPGMTIKVYDGTQTSADAGLVANSGGRWTGTAVGNGIAHAVVTAEYVPDKYPKGVPEMLFRVRGAKLLDPRTGLTSYTDNPAVIAYNLLRGISYNGLHLIGLRAPADAIRPADAIAAANACDEAVALAAGGTEKRYRCGIVVRTDVSNRDVIMSALSAMAGKLIHAGGIYRLQAGVAQTAVAHLTDDDIMSREPLVTSPRRPRSEMVNAVFGSFADPAIGYKMRPLPGRTSSSDEAADGGIRLPITVEMPNVFSRTQAQRLMEIERRRSRRMGTVSFVARGRWSVLEAGDWFTLTSIRRGYAAKSFEIVSTIKRDDQQIEIKARENDAAFDDWNPATDELADNAVTSLPPGMPAVATVTPTGITNVTVSGGGGVSRPGLNVQWTPPADPTIVELAVQFRQVGDTVALDRLISTPEAGSATWVDGVQSGATYEVRLMPRTQPRREAAWSSWVAATTTTAHQVVASALGSTPPAGSVGETELDAETLFNLRFAQLAADQEGSLAAAIERVRNDVQTLGASVLTHRVDLAETAATVRVEKMERTSLGEAFASYQVAVDASLAGKAATSVTDALNSRVTANEVSITSQGSAITQAQSDIAGKASTASVNALDSRVTSAEGSISSQGSAITQLQSDVAGKASAAAVSSLQTQVTEIDGDVQATAAAITTVGTQVDGVESNVSLILQDQGGNKKFLLVMENDGKVVVPISVDGTTLAPTLAFAGADFSFYDPNVEGGAPLPLVNIASVGGEAKFLLNGAMIAAAIEAGTVSVIDLSAISANLGTVTAGVIQGAKTYMNLDNGDFWINA